MRRPRKQQLKYHLETATYWFDVHLRELTNAVGVIQQARVNEENAAILRTRILVAHQALNGLQDVVGRMSVLEVIRDDLTRPEEK